MVDRGGDWARTAGGAIVAAGIDLEAELGYVRGAGRGNCGRRRYHPSSLPTAPRRNGSGGETFRSRWSAGASCRQSAWGGSIGGHLVAASPLASGADGAQSPLVGGGCGRRQRCSRVCHSSDQPQVKAGLEKIRRSDLTKILKAKYLPRFQRGPYPLQ